MANLLQTPANWNDGTVAPPAVWNGTAYAFTAPVTITYTGTVADGDTLAATVASTSSGDYDAGHHVAVMVNGVDALTWDFSQQSYPPGGTVNITLAAGDAVSIVAKVDGCGYPPQFTLTPPAVPPPPPLCAEMGRVTRIYASGYDRARVHDGRLVRGESRCLVVDFNGAIPAGRTVSAVTWRCSDPSVIVMSNARIQTDTRSVAVDVRANLPCDTAIKCEATLDNGEAYMQLIRLAVMDSPWFDDETVSAGGPGDAQRAMNAAKPPKVTFRDIDPLQDYYNDGDGNLYSVARLVDDAKDLPVFEVPLAAISLTSAIWDGENVYGLAFHVQKCMRADLSCPILLDWNGAIADGRHRVIKALATGKRTIKARRMTWKPDPDRKAE